MSCFCYKLWWQNHQIITEVRLTSVGKVYIIYGLQNNPSKTSPHYPFIEPYPLHPNTHTHSPHCYFITIELSFWECHKNGIIEFQPFEIDFFSPRKMLLKFIQVLCVSSVSSFLSLRCLVFHYMNALRFVYPFTHWRTFELFPGITNYKQSFCKYLCRGFVNLSFQFTWKII